MEKEERYLSIFLAKRVDGIILVTTAQTAGEHYQRLKKYSVPCVLVDRMLAGRVYGGNLCGQLLRPFHGVQPAHSAS